MQSFQQIRAAAIAARRGVTPKEKFGGTSNPRHLRVLHALLCRPLTREQLDRAAGVSNGPELIAELRRRGLELPCDLSPVIDRDGRAVRRGVYSMTAADRRKVRKFFSQNREGGA